MHDAIVTVSPDIPDIQYVMTVLGSPALNKLEVALHDGAVPSVAVGRYGDPRPMASQDDQYREPRRSRGRGWHTGAVGQAWNTPRRQVI